MTSTSPRNFVLLVLFASLLVCATACGSKKADDATATTDMQSVDTVQAETPDNTEVVQNSDQETPSGDTKKGVVTTKEKTDLRIRSQPTVESNVVGKIPHGTTIDIIGEDEKTTTLEGERGKWLKVRYLDLEGWVWGPFIAVQK